MEKQPETKTLPNGKTLQMGNFKLGEIFISFKEWKSEQGKTFDTEGKEYRYESEIPREKRRASIIVDEVKSYDHFEGRLTTDMREFAMKNLMDEKETYSFKLLDRAVGQLSTETDRWLLYAESNIILSDVWLNVYSDEEVQEFFSDIGFPTRGKVKCESCNRTFVTDDITSGSEGQIVCQTCYDEADAIATVFKNGDEHNPETVTEYRNDTPFKFGYHRSDGWRGYWEVTESGNYTNVHDDNILSMSEDSVDLQEFDKKVKSFCHMESIEFYVVICRSSNVFSSGYDIFVNDARAEEVKEFIKTLLSKGMRDKMKYNTEALTGVPASEQTKEDKDAALAMMMVKQGADPEQAAKTVKVLNAMDKLLKAGNSMEISAKKAASKGKTPRKNASKKPKKGRKVRK